MSCQTVLDRLRYKNHHKFDATLGYVVNLIIALNTLSVPCVKNRKTTTHKDQVKYINTTTISQENVTKTTIP